MVDLDLKKLQSLGLTPLDVTNAMTAQNLTVPSGLAKIGQQQYPISLNATPDALATLENAPIKVVDGQPVLVRDVAWVRDGSPPQINSVLTNGSPSVLMKILKNGNASTLDVVNEVKKALVDVRAAAPKDLKIQSLFDQSVFVSAAISEVIQEATAVEAGDVEVYRNNFKKCSDLVEAHDPSRGRDASVPAPDEILADVKVLADWAAELRARQNAIA